MSDSGGGKNIDEKSPEVSGGSSSPAPIGVALYTTVPVNLFRLGNASGPRLDNIRPQDVPTYEVGTGENAVKHVKPDGGISTFDGMDKTRPGKWWCIPANVVLPDTVRITKDHKTREGLTHYSLRPSRVMALLTFAEGLRAIAEKAVPMFTVPAKGAGDAAKTGSEQ